MYFDKNKLENQKITDKFKHALIHCEATKFGRGDMMQQNFCLH